jgi:hypothetical protein
MTVESCHRLLLCMTLWWPHCVVRWYRGYALVLTRNDFENIFASPTTLLLWLWASTHHIMNEVEIVKLTV